MHPKALEYDSVMTPWFRICDSVSSWNFVGITKVDEHVIKHILPRSSCRV